MPQAISDGIASINTVLSPNSLILNPIFSKYINISNKIEKLSGENSITSGKRRVWAVIGVESNDFMASSKRILSWATCWSIITSPLLIGETIYFEWTCQILFKLTWFESGSSREANFET